MPPLIAIPDNPPISFRPLFIALAGVVTFCLIMIGALAIDWYMGTADSREARITLLEQKMREKTRPVINVQRATIYNTDGEIVIEDK